MSHPRTTGESTIRPFRHEDAPAVAALFQELLSPCKRQPGSDLVTHLRRHYLEGPFAAPDCPALVHVGADGVIMGFGGRVVQPFAFGERVLRGAILGNLMVRNHKRAPTAGAALLRALAGGPQDITLSETANPASLAMWRQLRGQVLDRHSIDFFRILKPAGALLDLAARRIRAARLLLPLSRPLDRLVSSRRRAPKWTGLPDDFAPAHGLRTQAIPTDDFAGIFERLTRDCAGVPLWPGNCLPAVVAEASAKRTYGTPHLRAAVTPGGAPIGIYLFHHDAAGPVRVTEMVHAPGQAGPVLDALFTDARDLGASYVRGRIRPPMLEALMGRKAILASGSASVIRTKDAQVAQAFMQGEVHFNGLVGERWTRFIGDCFEPAAAKTPEYRPLAGKSAAMET